MKKLDIKYVNIYNHFKVKIIRINYSKTMAEICPICGNEMEKCTCEQDYEFYEPTTADLDDDE